MKLDSQKLISSPERKGYFFKDKNISPTRYRGFPRVFQLNLSKILNNYGKFQQSEIKSQCRQNEDLILISNKHPLKQKTPFNKFTKVNNFNRPNLIQSDLQPISNRRKYKNQQLNAYCQRNIQGSASNKSVCEKKNNLMSRDACYKNKTTLSNSPQKKIQRSKSKVQNVQKETKNFPNQKKQNSIQKKQLKPICLIGKNSQELKEIKSQAFAIYEHETNRLVYTQRGNVSYEIASLTKIMTFYSAIKIARENNLDISTCKITVEDYIMETTGTSAEILSGQQYTIQQLFYGLMLPSGNDAALCLAQWGGQFLTIQAQNEIKIKAFVNQMNKNSKDLNLIGTRFANPHGLPNFQSSSTAIQIAKLSSVCLSDPFFKKVVSTRYYKCKISNLLMKTERQVEWENTNKLLRRKGFLGIKTGITVTAGPCLASAYQFKDKTYIVVLLRANKISRRFKQTRKLLHWSLSKLHEKDISQIQKKELFSLKRNNQDLDSDNSEDEQIFEYDIANQAQFKKRANIICYEM